MRMPRRRQVSTCALFGALASHGGSAADRARDILGGGRDGAAIRVVAQTVDDPCEFDRRLTQQRRNAPLFDCRIVMGSEG